MSKLPINEKKDARAAVRQDFELYVFRVFLSRYSICHRRFVFLDKSSGKSELELLDIFLVKA
jgi:hypothetical protein